MASMVYKANVMATMQCIASATLPLHNDRPACMIIVAATICWHVPSWEAMRLSRQPGAMLLEGLFASAA